MSDHLRKGYVIHCREIMDQPPYSDLSNEHFRLFYRLCMRASFKERTWCCVRCGDNIHLKPGDIYINVEKEACQYNLTPDQFFYQGGKLVEIGILAKTSRKGCHTILSVSDWNYFSIENFTVGSTVGSKEVPRKFQGSSKDRDNNVKNDKNEKRTSHTYVSQKAEQPKAKNEQHYAPDGTPLGNGYVDYAAQQKQEPQGQFEIPEALRSLFAAARESQGLNREALPPVPQPVQPKVPERTPEEVEMLHRAQRMLEDARRNAPRSNVLDFGTRIGGKVR